LDKSKEMYVLNDLMVCAESHEGANRLIGNVRADEIYEVCKRAAERVRQTSQGERADSAALAEKIALSLEENLMLANGLSLAQVTETIIRALPSGKQQTQGRNAGS
jgi:hypothetical protein